LALINKINKEVMFMDITTVLWIFGIVITGGSSIIGWYCSSLNKRLEKHSDKLEDMSVTFSVGLTKIEGQLNSILSIMATKDHLSDIDKELTQQITDVRGEKPVRWMSPMEIFNKQQGE